MTRTHEIPVGESPTGTGESPVLPFLRHAQRLNTLRTWHQTVTWNRPARKDAPLHY